ncbi:MAG TPA: TetR/AcrR family transcriptional regulator [Dysgonomonas sp.]|nr:TetR/AcrR family transcriptional regulator [Dysgonomonas sp.]
MKYSKEYILERAFDVFMEKGYDSISISVLQQELGMSRGAMYRYFRNKEELFVSVVDVYFFKIFDRILKNVKEDLTVKELIEVVYRRQKLIAISLTKVNITSAVFLNYTALMIQAAKHYPNFVYKFKKIEKRLLESWKNALKNSMEAGEIRKDTDIDIICVLFSNTTMREASSNKKGESRFSFDIVRDVEGRKKVMDYLYSLIKI